MDLGAAVNNFKAGDTFWIRKYWRDKNKVSECVVVDLLPDNQMKIFIDNWCEAVFDRSGKAIYALEQEFTTLQDIAEGWRRNPIIKPKKKYKPRIYEM